MAKLVRKTLTDNEKRLLRQIVNEGQSDGWARVSHVVLPLIEKLPEELIEKESRNGGGAHVRVTERGLAVAIYA